MQGQSWHKFIALARMLVGCLLQDSLISASFTTMGCQSAHDVEIAIASLKVSTSNWQKLVQGGHALARRFASIGGYMQANT